MTPTSQQYGTDCCHSCYKLSSSSKMYVCKRALNSPPTCTCWGSAPSGSAVRSHLAAKPSTSQSCPLVKTHPRTGCHPSWNWGPPPPPPYGRKVLCWEGETKIYGALWRAAQNQRVEENKVDEVRESRCGENKMLNQRRRERKCGESVSIDSRSFARLLLEPCKSFPNSLSVTSCKAECIYCRWRHKPTCLYDKWLRQLRQHALTDSQQ